MLKGFDGKSTEILQQTAQVLALGHEHEKLLQMVYDLGVTDGQLKTLAEMINKGKS